MEDKIKNSMNSEIKEVNNSESSMNIPKKKSIVILVLLSIITLGIYCCFWYIKRVPELNNLKTKAKAKKGLAIFILILHILLIASIAGLFIDASIEKLSTGDIYLTNNEVPLMFTILFFTAVGIILIETLLFILLAFSNRKILNETLTNKGIKRKVSGFYTFFLNYYYLQYEINRIILDKEEQKRIGPLVTLIVLILIDIGIGIYFNIIRTAN